MSNILKVTTPLAGYDNNTIRQNPNQQQQEVTSVQAPVMPEKVVRPDGRNDAGADAQAQMRLNYESNFSNFVRLLKDTPDSVEELAQMLREHLSSFSGVDLAGDGAGVLAAFFSRIGMEEGAVPGYMQEQLETSMRFQGPFFNLIRQAFNETSSVELKAGILDFLRRYADMASGNHILFTIENALKECQARMFSGPAAELKALAQELRAMNARPGEGLRQKEVEGNALRSYEGSQDSRDGQTAEAGGTDGAAMGQKSARLPGQEEKTSELIGQTWREKGDTEENASFVKEKILPFLNRYISGTHDRGNLRNITVQMAYQLSRYENGSMEGLKGAYQRLLGFQEFRDLFGELPPEALAQVLRRTADDSEKEAVLKGFMKMITDGMKGNGSVERKQALHNFVQNSLLNESVYMPVLHLSLPMLVGGRMIYSELWVDPDAEGIPGRDEEERAVKMLVKFDIEDVGFFDLFFIYQGGRMDLQLDYPDELAEHDKEIRDGVAKILSENSIRVENFVTGSSAESIPLAEAFPKLLEKREGINVRA